jgi:D-apionolactonase
MPVTNVIRYGREDALPERKLLHAGQMTAVYEQGDLRWVRWGEHEVLRRVYMAVRDRNWGTLPAQLRNVSIISSADSFRVRYQADYAQGDVRFTARIEITGEASGSITWTLDGEALTTFLKNRIGWCVLHPIVECAGKRCRVETASGEKRDGEFPRFIAPHQPFLDMRAISHEVAPGTAAEVRFEGDIFETEDQRNWTDASFKTYSTPLHLPYPAEIRAGTRIHQSVRLTLRSSSPVRAARGGSAVGIALDAGRRTRLPRIGLAIASHGAKLEDGEAGRIRALALSHLRAEVDFRSADPAQALRRARAESEQAGVPLELAVTLAADPEKELDQLGEWLAAAPVKLRQWLLYHASEKATGTRWLRLARPRVEALAAGTPMAGGTAAYFTELNRNRPEAAALDAVCFSANPQVHAFDNASLAENAAAQGYAVESAKHLFAKPVFVTPVSLRPRFNPDATAPESPIPGQLPSKVDPRQMSLFGAAWTLASLKYLAEAGADSVTYFETTGWLGVMETRRGSDPALFPSTPGAVFPLYFVLRDAGEFAGGEAVGSVSSQPLEVEALMLERDGRRRLLVANLGPEAREITVAPVGGAARIRRLNAANTEHAMREPGQFAAAAMEPLPACTWTIAPFEYACVDFGA